MTVQFRSSRRCDLPVSVARPSGRLPECWTDERDQRLLDAKGRYAVLDGLAREWEVSVQVLLARWHRLRVGGASKPSPAGKTVPFEVLVSNATEGVAAVLLLLRAGPRSYPEIAAMFDLTTAGARGKVTRARHLCEVYGWRIDGFVDKSLYQLELVQCR